MWCATDSLNLQKMKEPFLGHTDIGISQHTRTYVYNKYHLLASGDHWKVYDCSPPWLIKIPFLSANLPSTGGFTLAMLHQGEALGEESKGR